jgi:hypothetical protein
MYARKRGSVVPIGRSLFWLDSGPPILRWSCARVELSMRLGEPCSERGITSTAERFLNMPMVTSTAGGARRTIRRAMGKKSELSDPRCRDVSSAYDIFVVAAPGLWSMSARLTVQKPSPRVKPTMRLKIVRNV